MLISFSVENHLSFKERCKLSLLPSKGTKHASHIIKSDASNGFHALKMSVIYGANASGKSNLIKSMSHAQSLIVDGVALGKKINYFPFKLSTETESAPSRFEFEIKIGQKYYAYGFVVDRYRFKEEWLYEVNKTRDKCIFERSVSEGEYVYEFSNLKFNNDEHEQFFRFTATGTPENRLFLREFVERNVIKKIDYLNEINQVYKWFDHKLTIIFPNSKYSGLELHVKENENRNKISKILSSFDTGIDEIKTQELNVTDTSLDIPDGLKRKIIEEIDDDDAIIISSPTDTRYLFKKEGDDIKINKLVSSHKNENQEERIFEISEESDGTQRLLDLAPCLIDLILKERVYVIDELDRSLHPEITMSIVDAFLNNTSGKESQLVVTTHETNILDQDLIRKDSVWFTQKEKDGSSSLYSLQEFKPRFDKDIRRGYLAGRFGGVPLIKNCKDLSWLNDA